jgi:hypothetical protein
LPVLGHSQQPEPSLSVPPCHFPLSSAAAMSSGAAAVLVDSEPTTTTTPTSAGSSPAKSTKTGPTTRRPSEDSLRPPQMPYATSSTELHASPSSGSLASTFRPGGFGTAAESILSSKPSQTPLVDWGRAASDAFAEQAASEKHCDEAGDSSSRRPGPKPFKPANRFGGGGGRDWRFWMVFLSILLSTFIAALDMVRLRPSSARLPS